MKSRPSEQRVLYRRVLVVAIILTLAGGWILTAYLGSDAEKGFRERFDREANLIASLLNDYLGDVDNAAKTLNQAHSMDVALSSGSPADLERAGSTLGRYKNSLGMSACYLLDRSGLVVASSNGDEESGSAGRFFPFRQYIRGALAGRLTRFFALDGATRERGYYVAAPVTDGKGAITGVIVIKRNITPIEAAFRKYPQAFLVSPEGIVFITSREKLLFRALWPIDEKRRAALLASGQFGNIGFEPLLATEPSSGTYVNLNSRKHFVQRLAFGSDGWTLVFMKHPHVVSNTLLFGVLLTIVFVLMLLFFYIVLSNKEESLEAAGNLLKAKEDWRRTIDAVPDLIVIIDTDHRIISMNRAMAERLGISPQEAIGRRCFELLHGMSEPSPSCPHSKMLESGRAVSETVFEKKLSGSFVVTAAPILAEDGTIESSVHVMHDVTEQTRLADEVNRIHNLESIGILAGGLAHDFNNVLNIICGNISFARILAEGNAAVGESLIDAEEACERAKELGTRLQAFSKGSSPLKEPIALPAIIEDAAGAAFKDSNIAHTVSAADDLFPLEADPRQIRQVFENLLSNAKDAMPDGGKVGIEIDNFADDGKKMVPLGAGSYVRILLQDNGKGIPKENLPKIFDPYFSTKDTFSQKGLGLGLSICHAILKRHKGHISVESESGIGTRVSVYLPAAVGETKGGEH